MGCYGEYIERYHIWLELSPGYGIRILPKYNVACVSIRWKMTVRANSASSPTSNPVGLKYNIFQPGTSIIFVFLIISLLYLMTFDFGNLFLLAEAQSSITTSQGGQNANEAIQTFYIDGAIGSLVSDLLDPTTSTGEEENVTGSLPPIYVLVGNWSMGVVNGEVNYFQVDFIMGLENGTQMQIYSVENLENIVISPPSSSSSPPEQEAGSTPGQELSSNDDNLVLSSTNNYSLSLFGYVDVSTTGDTVQWRNVPASIDIFNGNIISILLYPSETDNRFKGQPIYGVVTDILDANNNLIKPSIWASAT
jgi:hypothetical protein